jgi:hypothetical protein
MKLALLKILRRCWLPALCLVALVSVVRPARGADASPETNVPPTTGQELQRLTGLDFNALKSSEAEKEERK